MRRLMLVAAVGLMLAARAEDKKETPPPEAQDAEYVVACVTDAHGVSGLEVMALDAVKARQDALQAQYDQEEAAWRERAKAKPDVKEPEPSKPTVEVVRDRFNSETEAKLAMEELKHAQGPACPVCKQVLKGWEPLVCEDCGEPLNKDGTCNHCRVNHKAQKKTGMCKACYAKSHAPPEKPAEKPKDEIKGDK